eukprot:590270-Rhodomonas_salina.1
MRGGKKGRAPRLEDGIAFSRAQNIASESQPAYGSLTSSSIPASPNPAESTPVADHVVRDRNRHNSEPRHRHG